MVDKTAITTIKLTQTVPSAVIFAEKIIHLEDGNTYDLRDDPRLDLLVKQTKNDIETNGWHLPQDEKEISTHIVELMNKPELFGPYDQTGIEFNHKLNKLEKELTDLNNIYGKTLDAKKVAAIEAEINEISKAWDNYIYSWRPNGASVIAKLPSGKLFCGDQAAIVSYTQHAVGIENSFCYDNSDSDFSDRHAFVQSLLTRNIIEAIEPKTPYIENLSGGLIADGDMVVTHYGDTYYLKFYGGGMGTTEVAKDAAEKQVIDSRNVCQSMAKAFAQYEQKYAATLPIEELSAKKGEAITVTQAQKNITRFFINMDVVQDGKFSSKELFEGLKKAGLKLSDREKGEFREGADEGLALPSEMINKFVRRTFQMDANHDGTISSQEFQTMVDKLIEDRKNGQSSSPLDMDNQLKLNQAVIYRN